MLKIIFTLVMCVIGIVLGFYSPTINNQLVSGLINMIGIAAFLWQYLYSNMDVFYLSLNKLMQKFRNPKFDLIQSLNVKFCSDNLDENFLEQLVTKLAEKIENEFDSYAKVSSKPSKSQATIVLDENGVASISLSLARTDEDEYQLFIEYKNSVEYNDRIQELKIIRNVFDTITDGIHVIKKEIQIRLFFKNRNPFYESVKYLV